MVVVSPYEYSPDYPLFSFLIDFLYNLENEKYFDNHLLLMAFMFFCENIIKYAMKKIDLEPADLEIFQSFADDFIALNFKGNHYSSTIKFVEVLLDRLKLQLENADDKIIKDILGR